MQVNITQAKDYLIECIKVGIVPMLEGPPAMGKSDLIRSIADYFKLKVIDLRLSQCDPSDLLGFPHFKDNGKATYIPMDIWPVEGDPIPKGYKGFLLFFDEFNSASRAVQAASYKILLDRCVGQHKLHSKTAIVCAGNRMQDNAIVNRLSTATQSRLAHFELAIDHKPWLDWAVDNDIDHRILAHINDRPDNLFVFDPVHNNKTFASPRTWFFASKLIKRHPGDLMEILPLLASVIGEAVAREFAVFTSIYTDLPHMKEIEAFPATTRVPDDPSTLYAIAYLVAANTDDKNISKLMEYIDRLPIEFATITLQSVLKKHRPLLTNPSVQTWLRVKGAELF